VKKTKKKQSKLPGGMVFLELILVFSILGNFITMSQSFGAGIENTFSIFWGFLILLLLIFNIYVVVKMEQRKKEFLYLSIIYLWIVFSLNTLNLLSGLFIQETNLDGLIFKVAFGLILVLCYSSYLKDKKVKNIFKK